MEPHINHTVHKFPARVSIMNHETDASSNPLVFYHFRFRINIIFIANVGLSVCPFFIFLNSNCANSYIPLSANARDMSHPFHPL